MTRYTDDACDLQREIRDGIVDNPFPRYTDDTIRYTPPRFIPERKVLPPLPPVDPSSRHGRFTGWYNDEAELAAELDQRCKRKWRLVDGFIETEFNGVYSSRYEYRHHRGRIFVYDPEVN